MTCHVDTYLNCGQIPLYPPTSEATDIPSMDQFKIAMKTLGFTKKCQNQIFQVLAGILNLGNIEFTEENRKREDGACVKNRALLEKTANLLGVNAERLESSITTATFLSGDTLCSSFLDIPQSVKARNSLASIIYQTLFRWIIEQINARFGTSRLGGSDFACQIGLLDVAGFEDRTPKVNGLDQLLGNYANEKLRAFILQRGINSVSDALILDGLTLSENLPAPVDVGRISLFEEPKKGIFRIINRETNRISGKESTILAKCQDIHADKKEYFESGPEGWSTFKVKHYTGQFVSYNVNDFISKNKNSLQADVINLFGITLDSTTGQKKPQNFIASLFTDSVIEAVLHPKNEAKIVGARIAAPARVSQAGDRPDSIKKKSTMLLSMPALNTSQEKVDSINDSKKPKSETIVTQLQTALDELLAALNGMRAWSILCMKPNGEQLANKFDEKIILNQTRAFKLLDMVQAARVEYTVGIQFEDFESTYVDKLHVEGTSKVYNSISEKCLEFISSHGWNQFDNGKIGKSRVFLTEKCWRGLESILDIKEGENSERRRIHGVQIIDKGHQRTAYKKSQMSLYSPKSEEKNEKPNEIKNNEHDLEMGQNDQSPDVDSDEEQNGEKKAKKRCCGGGVKRSEPREPKVVEKMSRNRRCWVTYTWLVTWYFPDSFLVLLGKKTEGVRMAWREKVALCYIVLFLSGVMIFFVQGFGKILCPVQNYFSADEVKQRKDPSKKSMFVSFNGYVYDIFAYQHPGMSVFGAAGNDISGYFQRSDPVDNTPFWPTCGFLQSNYILNSPFPVDPSYTIANNGMMEYSNETNSLCTSTNVPNTIGYCHDYFSISNYIKIGLIHVYKIGMLAFSQGQVNNHYSPNDAWVTINGKVYNVTALYGLNPIYSIDNSILNLDILGAPGGDASLNSSYIKPEVIDCFDHLFLVGFIDRRVGDAGCNASAYILYGVTGVMVAIMIVKFLAALQLAPRVNPEKNDRFVIMQVPCYNEGESSLMKTIESLAVMEYDDTRKLLFIVADGMIKSAGSDMSTPDIVLQILGVDKSLQQPEAKSYLAIGRGLKEHNKAKVYSGLYSVQARYVPFIVVIKSGKEGETEKPGNRGKRDSQMILMKFLNRVNFGAAMTPLELEIYHHIKNIIGVDPFLYEYCLMVDADTRVESNSLNRLISCMVNDANTMGICGETQIENEKESWVTMMQVSLYLKANFCF
jgi:chitin synthase